MSFYTDRLETRGCHSPVTMTSHELNLLKRQFVQGEDIDLCQKQGCLKVGADWALGLSHNESLVSLSTQDHDSNIFNSQMLFPVVFSKKSASLGDMLTDYRESEKSRFIVGASGNENVETDNPNNSDSASAKKLKSIHKD
ncbi:hypothetical protein TNCV_3486991 [Trichonephila clavipes]|nr:hypothetical protein TNCV_3486991 [Trichonephila clavipes]